MINCFREKCNDVVLYCILVMRRGNLFGIFVKNEFLSMREC